MKQKPEARRMTNALRNWPKLFVIGLSRVSIIFRFSVHNRTVELRNYDSGEACKSELHETNSDALRHLEC